MNETKKCPYCGQEIKAVAKKCRHCGKWLDESVISQSSASVNPMNENQTTTKHYLLYSISSVIVLAIIGMIVYTMVNHEKTTYSEQTDVNSYSQSYQTTSAYKEDVTVAEVVEEDPTEEIRTANTSDLLTIQSMMNLSQKKAKEVIKILRDQGLHVEFSGAFYTCDIPEGRITIFDRDQPRAGIGAVEFGTSSKSVYRNWINQLEVLDYTTDNGNLWHGDNAHKFGFGVFDFSNVEEDGEDYAGGYTLCVSGFPMLYDEKLEHYVEYEYKY